MEVQLPSRQEEEAQQAVEGEEEFAVQAVNEPIERLQVRDAVSYSTAVGGTLGCCHHAESFEKWPSRLSSCIVQHAALRSQAA